MKKLQIFLQVHIDHQVQEAWQATIAMAHVASYYPHGNYPKYSYNYPTYCEHTVTM